MNDRSEPDRPAVVFTGDTLFIGDVGRPDLSGNHTPEQLAAIMSSFRRGLEVLLAPALRPINQTYGEDEMFIG